MKKKVLAMAIASLMLVGLIGCGSKSESSVSLKVGMVTNSGTIDDQSFNQGTWEGLKEADKKLKTDSNYMQPTSETESEYLTEIQNLYDSGHKFILLPGYKFEKAAYVAQNKYPDANFVIIDGSPTDNNGNVLVAKNTAAIYFAEEQAGFVAAVAASVQLKEGEFGFMGGMKIPSVQRFSVGFQQGIEYANKNYGTNISLKQENIVYAGSFSDTALGQQIAASMYDNGVKAIFSAAGDLGSAVITEAKSRVVKGNEVWAIGVDSDQYNDGIYESNKSVVLTSAVKKINEAAYQMVEKQLKGEFPGGETITFNASNDGVGIPEKNPNLSDDSVAKANEVLELIKNGTIQVKSEV